MVMIIFILLGALCWFGIRLMNKDNQSSISATVSEKEKLIVEELKNIQSIKVNIVSADILYRKAFAVVCIFMPIYFGLALLIDFVCGLLHFSTKGFLGDGIAVTLMMGVMLSIFLFKMSWDVLFFRYAILPNMQPTFLGSSLNFF
jgi:hypothetical protein